MPEIAVNGVTLHYDLRGPEGAPVVAFSNSLGTTREMWEPQISALAGRFRCLSYDTRGHGRSPVVKAGFGIDDLARDLGGLIESTVGARKVHVVGLSLGGMTAMALAALRSDLVATLTPMATFARTASPAAWVERAAVVRNGGVEAFADVILDRWFTPSMDRTVVARYRAMLLGIDREGYAACCDAIRDQDQLERLTTLDVPTLVFSGADDPASPPSLQDEIRDRIPGAGLVRVSPAAHICNIEQPAQVNAMLAAWLDLNRHRVGAARSAPATRDEGLANRKAVLGEAHVARSLAGAGGFAMPWQDFIMRTAWGEVWGDDTLAWKQRSLIVLGMMIALGKEEEFKLHLKPALNNGVTPAELRALFTQAAVYCGVPAGNGAFRMAMEVLGEALED